MRRVAFAVLLSLAACGRPHLDAEGERRLAAHAEPSTWEDLDPAHPGAHLRDPRTGVTFVRIEAAEFVMGSNRLGEAPAHRVRLTRPFLLAETELTVAQWQRWVRDFAGDSDVPVPKGGDDMPMQASWNDAVAFCRAFGYRLPTEAEWECGALGGVAGDAPQWHDVEQVEAHGWVHTDASRPVRQKLPNGFGLYDTIGNLAEWCSDFLSADYRGRPDPDIDPQGAPAGEVHMLRGGSWYTLPRPQPQTRTFGGVDERNGFYGFRPARSL